MKRRSCPSMLRPRHAGCFWSAEGAEVALRVDHRLDGSGAESAYQLVLEIGDAHVEAQQFHLDARELRAEAGPLETAPEHVLFTFVTEPGQRRVGALRAEPGQEAPHRLRTSDRHDRDALACEVPAPARGERLEGDLVADALDEHDRPCA